jgi:hypothetical protein
MCNFPFVIRVQKSKFVIAGLDPEIHEENRHPSSWITGSRRLAFGRASAR